MISFHKNVSCGFVGCCFLMGGCVVLVQVLTVPFIAGLTGKKIPALTWCAAVAALFGVGLLETTGAPPSVRFEETVRYLI